MRRKKEKAWKTILTCLGVGLVVLAPWALERYGHRVPVHVSQLKVLGGQVLSEIDLRSILSFKEGDPLFGNKMGKAIDRLSANPRVASVAVVRDVTGRVKVNVKERKTAAIVNVGALHFMDENGDVMESVSTLSKEATDLPVLSGPWTDQKTTQGYQSRLVEALSLLRTLDVAGISQASISELHWREELGWILYRVGTRSRVIVGRDRFEEKAMRLARVARELRGRERLIREIDLDLNDRAVVKVTGSLKRLGNEGRGNGEKG